jgi:hypothetical protein
VTVDPATDDTAQPRYIGWRYWRAGHMDLAGEIRVVLVSPLRGGINRWLDATAQTATCLRGHAAPAPECSCGFRVTRSLPDLVHFMWDRHQEDEASPSIVIGRVEGFGRAQQGLSPSADWNVRDCATTIRVEHMRIIGPLLFSPAIAVSQDDFHRYFPVRVRRHSSRFGTYQEWLTRMSRLYPIPDGGKPWST